MSQTAANLMVALFDGVVGVKVAGRANFTCSVDLKKVVQALSERGYSRFVLDLTDCLLMDSTFLGVLAGIGLKFGQGNGTHPQPVELLNPNPRIADLLENLGVAHLFKIITDCKPMSEDFKPIEPAASADRAEVTRTCLEAHRTLMDINPNNVQKFKDVAQFLTEDLKNIEAREQKK
jgi:anti-sigma B factor antagonist